MTYHLSIQLPWHDRGWDGCVCDEPKKNTFCLAQRLIRADRRIDLEEKYKGKPFSELMENGEEYLPPCAMQVTAYSSSKNPVLFVPGNDSPIELPPFSTPATPSKWLQRFYAKNILKKWRIYDGDIVYNLEYNKKFKINLLYDFFWSKIQPGESLVFYYLKNGMPFYENNRGILVGIGKITRLQDLEKSGYDWSNMKKYQLSQLHYRNVVIQDFSKQGARIPYHEFQLDKSLREMEKIACVIPIQFGNSFSYDSDLVTDDQAITLVTRMIRFFNRHKDKAKASDQTDWERQQNWLENILTELKRSRPKNPGLASFLHYFKEPNSISFAEVLFDWEEKNERNLENSIFNSLEPENFEGIEKWRSNMMLKIMNEWGKLKDNNEDKAELLKLLTRFEISPKQIKNFTSPTYLRYLGISCFKDIIDNPYLLVERDTGKGNEFPVLFETIDQGMKAHGTKSDDPKRIRALINTILTIESFDGPLEIPIENLFEYLKDFVDINYIQQNQTFFEEIANFRIDDEDNSKMVGLKKYAEQKAFIESFVKKEIPKVNGGPDIDWLQCLVSEDKRKGYLKEEKSYEEQVNALEIMYRNRISVLQGGAGTGKTTLLGIFLKALDDIREEKGIHNTICLLTPSGKARVRLTELARKHNVPQKWLNRNVKTIYQFFRDRKMLVPGTLRVRSDLEFVKPYQVNNLIIDECSMIPVDDMAHILNVIDTRRLKRLILVGDPNQLEPIGPGTPFDDVINILKDHEDKESKRIALLTQCHRTAPTDGEKTAESKAIKVANGFLEEAQPTEKTASLNILQRLEQKKHINDLELFIWNDWDDLFQVIDLAFEKVLGVPKEDWKAFNETLGIEDSQRKRDKFFDWDRSKIDGWQIICPTRVRYFGTNYINQRIQQNFKLKLQSKGRNPKKPAKSHKDNSRIEMPFGNLDLVYGDKVLQISNCPLKKMHKRNQKDNKYRNNLRSMPDDSLLFVNEPSLKEDRNIKRVRAPVESIPYNSQGALHFVSNGEIGLVAKTTKDRIDVIYSSQPNVRYSFQRDQVDRYLELGYAITVHKAQGSEFGTVFFIIPKGIGNFLSKKLLYTGLTRARKKLVLLVEKDLEDLKSMVKS